MLWLVKHKDEDYLDECYLFFNEPTLLSDGMFCDSSVGLDEGVEVSDEFDQSLLKPGQKVKVKLVIEQ